MSDTEDTSTQQPTLGEQFRALIRQFPRLEDPVDLMETASAALGMLLRREADRAQLDDFSITIGEIVADLPLDGTEKELRFATRQAARHCLRLLKKARANRLARDEESELCGTDEDMALIDEILDRPEDLEDAAPSNTAVDEEERYDDEQFAFRPGIDDEEDKPNTDIEYFLPPDLAHLLSHLEYVVPEPQPIDQKPSQFEAWFCTAIIRRINRVLTFFQRHNPQITRELPPPFLLSPHFAERLGLAVEKLIFPTMRHSRQLRLLSSSIDCVHSDIDTFWETMDTTLRDALPMVWATGWDAVMPVEVERNGEHVLQLKSGTKELRDLLTPESPEHYDIPKLGVREIELFKSLLDPAIDWWPQLNAIWNDFHVLYEQEMDPRVFQQQAREGALRDNILAAAEKYPEQWGDFMVLLCHRVFPRINSTFLERFVRNIGQDEPARIHRMPYLMRYLKQMKDNPTIRKRERDDEHQWQDQVDELRKYLKGLRRDK